MKLTENFKLLATAPDGIKRLRGLILSLAVRGKLVPQDPNDEPASELLKQIRAEKDRLIAEGKITRDKPLPVIGEDEKPFKLPRSWAWARLPEIYASISPSGNKLMTSQMLKMGKFPVVDQGKSYIAGYTDNEAILIRLPEPVVIFGDHTTEIKYIDFDFVAGADGVKILWPLKQNAKFFYHHLRSFELEDRGYARHFKVLNESLYALPPLAEQSRIVAKVEELMALCDALETHGKMAVEQHTRLTATLFDALAASESTHQLQENWMRLASDFDLVLDRPEAIDVLEQTLLQLAVRGLLVEQDPNDEPASELLRQIRAEKDRLIAKGEIKKDKPLPAISDNEKPFVLPQGWEWVRFGSLINSSEAGWSPSCDVAPRVGDFWGVLKVSAVSWGEFRSYENKALPVGLTPRSEIEVKAGNFLLSRANTEELVARSVIADNPEPRLMMSDKIIRLNLSSLVNPSFFNQVNNTTNSRAYYIKHASGTSSSMKNISREVIMNLPVPLPPLAEQSRVVARVDELRTLCASLRERLATSLKVQTNLAESLIESAINDRK